MNRKIAHRINEVTPSATMELNGKVVQLKKEGIDVISFSVGEPDFETPASIGDAAKRAIDDGMTKYTAITGIVELRESICRKLKKENNIEYTPDEIIVTTGAKQALYNTFMTICNPGDEVIIPSPCWNSYMEMVKFAGGIPVFVESKQDNNFEPATEDIKGAVTERTVAILLNTPNNPTGAVYGKETIIEIGNVALKNNLWIIADEIYEHLIYDEAKHYSIVNIMPELKDQTIIINGMAKTYAMTGWRIGYAAANKNVIKSMSKIQGHMTSSATTFAQYGAVACADDNSAEIEKMTKEYSLRRRYMIDKLNSMKGINCADVKGAFYTFPDVSALLGGTVGDRVIADVSDLANYLLEEANIAVVPGSAFNSPNNIRLSYATSMSNIGKGLDDMATAIEKISVSGIEKKK